MTKKALLVGSSYSAAPFLMSLKNRGFYVGVCGRYPDDPCHQYADCSYFIDYSNFGELLALITDEKYDYIVPSCNDYSYNSCSQVAEVFGFPGFDQHSVTETLHTKSKFRDLAEHRLFPAPQFINCKTVSAVDTKSLQLPFLIKPADSSSGRGVTKLYSRDELKIAVDAAIAESRSNQCVVEEFIEGNLYSHSAFINGQEIALDFFVDEFCSVYPYQVDCSHHPSLITETLKRNIRECITRLSKFLRLVDGLLHTQFIANREGDFWIIETMRRAPGDLYGNLIERSTGIMYSDLYVCPFIGQELSLDDKTAQTKYVGRHTVTVDVPLATYAVSHSFPSDKVYSVPLKNSGEALGCAPYDKHSIIFVEYDNIDAMKTITPKMADYVSIQSLDEFYK